LVETFLKLKVFRHIMFRFITARRNAARVLY